MCGPENTNRPRGGALAALNPPSSLSCLTTSPVRGDLAFHTPGFPGSVSATHARLTLDAAHASSSLSDLSIVIHSSGDLTRDAHDCGLFRRFAFPAASVSASAAVRARREEDGDGYLELSLDEPLSLQVGNDGIIGRRVSLVSGAGGMLAEGIVGFNFLQPAQPLAAL